MADWNQNQWGERSYQPVYDQTPAPSYTTPSYPVHPPPNNGYATDQKNPYEGGRFTPKKRIHDPFFLVFFILQVSVLGSVARAMS